MKSKIFMSLIIGLLLLSGCSLFDEEDHLEKFEHYDLSEKNPKDYFIYTYTNDDNTILTYAFADITPNNSNTKVYGLLLQNKGNDYVLLDKIEPCGKPLHLFDKDKLYVTYCIGIAHEYTLNGIDTIKNDLSDKINYHYPISKIQKIDNDYIYFIGSGPSYRHEDKDKEIVKCSLKNYQCEIVDN